MLQKPSVLGEVTLWCSVVRGLVQVLRVLRYRETHLVLGELERLHPVANVDACVLIFCCCCG